MKAEEQRNAVGSYVGHLIGLARDLESGNPSRASAARGALAQLRRGLGKPAGTAAETFRHVVPYLPERLTDEDRDAFFLIGSLFAEHPNQTPSGDGGGRAATLGAVMRRLGDHESAEKRFVALLNCERARLDYHLRQAVRLAASHDVPVNWFGLLNDVLQWDSPNRTVQLNWARDYWRAARPEETDENASGEN